MVIWLDTETGTWGIKPPMTLDTEKWTDADWVTFDDHMTYEDRCQYGEEYGRDPRLMSPLAWYAERCVE